MYRVQDSPLRCGMTAEIIIVCFVYMDAARGLLGTNDGFRIPES